jgi:hypothetical protein
VTKGLAKPTHSSPTKYINKNAITKLSTEQIYLKKTRTLLLSFEVAPQPSNRSLANIENASTCHKGRRKTKREEMKVAYTAVLAGGTLMEIETYTLTFTEFYL